MLVAGAFLLDPIVQRWVAEHQAPGAKTLMRNVSRFGDWPEHAALGLVLAGIAFWRGSRQWTRVFLTMLLACLIAGGVARVAKVATGRARPSVKAEAGWNGPRLSSKYNAFPSGHTAASMAFFGVLFFVNWRLGLLALPIPLLIAASRMYVAAHYFSDVTVASLLGILVAALVARRAKAALAPWPGHSETVSS